MPHPVFCDKLCYVTRTAFPSFQDKIDFVYNLYLIKCSRARTSFCLYKKMFLASISLVYRSQ